MRILLLCTVYPPDILGGAEVAASHLAKWLASKGHDVGVLCTTESTKEASWGDKVDGVRIYRSVMPRPYPALRAATAARWLKPIWHLQDHLDLRNEWLLAKVLDAFKPDLVNVHIAQGLGHNMMCELARRNVATVYTLHDLGLACIKASMSKNGRNCERQEISCAVASKLKWHWLDRIERFSFWSPSQAHADKLGKFVPIETKRLAVIPYPLAYKPKHSDKSLGNRRRLLYLGRLHPTKGVDFLLDILAHLAAERGLEFEVRVAGTGPLEAELRRKYTNTKWCKFLGFVEPSKTEAVLLDSDVLCVPSMWDEPYGIVSVQALLCGLPVVASMNGASPEIVDHGVTGILCKTGCQSDWSESLARVILDAKTLHRLRSNTTFVANQFNQDVLGAKVVELFDATLSRKVQSR